MEDIASDCLSFRIIIAKLEGSVVSNEERVRVALDKGWGRGGRGMKGRGNPGGDDGAKTEEELSNETNNV